MTTSSPDDGSATLPDDASQAPAPTPDTGPRQDAGPGPGPDAGQDPGPDTGPDPGPDAAPSGSPPDEPVGPWQRWRARISGATVLTYSGVVVGALATAFLTPLGEQIVGTFFEDPTCPGEACDGKSPQKHGCYEDARTYEPTHGNPAALQIRWSEHCHTIWGKIARGNKGDLVTARAEGGDERSAKINYDHDQYTSMVAVVDGGFEARVCVIPGEHSESTFRRYCVHATDASDWR